MNVNGIQTAVERGLLSWLQAQNADVICLQDTRASAVELDDPAYQLDGYFLYSVDAEIPEQGGVARDLDDVLEVVAHGDRVRAGHLADRDGALQAAGGHRHGALHVGHDQVEQREGLATHVQAQQVHRGGGRGAAETSGDGGAA